MTIIVAVIMSAVQNSLSCHLYAVSAHMPMQSRSQCCPQAVYILLTTSVQACDLSVFYVGSGLAGLHEMVMSMQVYRAT